MFKRSLAIALALIAVAGLVVPVTTAQDAPAETPVTLIELSGPAAEPDAELSGLTWYGDTLVLLAENPNLYAGEESAGAIFALDKADILAYLDAGAPEPLEPRAVPILGPDIVETVPGFDGFEAITFVDESAYLLIEAANEDGTMRGVLVKGTVEPDLAGIALDLEGGVDIEAQTDYGNMSYESLLVYGESLVALYEINGADVNPVREGLLFSFDLAPAGSLPLDALEYRLTDTTAPDAEGRFWAVNYFFPGEDFLLPESDPLAEAYGEGATHAEQPHVERLVEMQITDEGIALIDQAPIQLDLPGEDARNWEGIARLDERGFLVVTDKYPQTLLGLVPVETGGMAAAGDPAAGEALFAEACAGCHGAEPGAGPALPGMGERAATRVEGMTAAEYLHESIVDPGAYLVEGYQDIMPPTYGDQYSEAELADLVAYLLAQ